MRLGETMTAPVRGCGYASTGWSFTSGTAAAMFECPRD